MNLRILSMHAAAASAVAALACWRPAAPQGGDERSALEEMFDYGNAGLIGYLIVAMSVVAIALVIENFVSLRRERLAPPQLVDELEGLLDDENFPAAAELCEQDRTYLTRCVGAGLARLGQPFETILTAVREMQTEELVKLLQKLGWLSLLARMAPMLGLFGTAIGMFVAFGAVARSSASSPATLVAGVKMALITTIFGLALAIPLGVCFFALKQRVIRLASEVNAIAEDLFERFRKPK